MQQTLFPMDSPAADAAPTRTLISRRALNEAQYEAVTCTEGPVLVIAGAGSGKTRTLVYRVAHLVDSGVAPDNILLLTFTRKSAQEMVNRASFLLDDSCRQVTGGTFHAVANMLLRRHGHHLGYAPNFTILDQGDAEGIINLLKSSLNLGGAGKRFPSKRAIINVISKAVNKAVAFDELLDQQFPHLAEFFGDLQMIREQYKTFKLEHGLMDYDDLLVNWQRVLKEIPEAGAEIAGRFSHIMVDEYQDTNPIQADIVRRMARSHQNVMVVGDDSQSIYSFRGADFRNIMEFPKLFPGTRIIRLEENYRSTQPILELTNAIIEQAGEKYSKTLFTKIEGGVRPLLYSARDEAEQARFVADRIMALRREDGVSLNEVAVLFRSGFHSYKLEMELTHRQLLFEKRGGLKLTESAHTKDLLAYLRVVTNPEDRLSWNRILLLLDKIGPKTARTILDRIRTAEDPVAALRDYPAGKSWQKGVADLVDLLTSLRDPNLPPQELFDLVMGYYQEIFERIYHDDYPRRRRDLEQLKEIIAGYDTLQAFIDDTALDPPQAEIGGADDPEAERLVLSTIHSAKGLEWDTVFVIHLTEGKFPSAQANSPAEMEEERRLLYVAATRARKNLYLSYPSEVMSPDRKFTFGRLSPFLTAIPASLMETKSMLSFNSEPTIGGRPILSVGKQATRKILEDDAGLSPGAAVRHPFFGEGRIDTVVGPRTVEVFFPRHGRKTLHLDYARLELLGS